MKSPSELRRENRALRKENKKLRKMLFRLSAPGQTPPAQDSVLPSRAKRMLRTVSRNFALCEDNNYPLYLWNSLHYTVFYNRSVEFFTNFRRYRIASKVIIFLSTLFAVLGTSAFLFLGLLTALCVVPVFTLSVSGTALLGLPARHAQTKKFRDILRTCDRVILYFPPAIPHEKHPAFSNGLFRETMCKPNTVVFIISPCLWATRGFGGHGFYTNARKESENVFLLRRHYFFSLRRLLRLHPDIQLTQLY